MDDHEFFSRWDYREEIYQKIDAGIPIPLQYITIARNWIYPDEDIYGAEAAETHKCRKMQQ